MTKVTARMTIRAGSRSTPETHVRGQVYDLADKAEVDRLMRIGAISIGGEMPKAAPIPAEQQAKSDLDLGSKKS